MCGCSFYNVWEKKDNRKYSSIFLKAYKETKLQTQILQMQMTMKVISNIEIWYIPKKNVFI